MRVRVFAGYRFEDVDLARPNFAAHGYANGVPMGADLGAAPDGAVPGLLIRAEGDLDGANLDLVQVVKGWLNADGTTSESVYDVACGGRKLLDTGCDGEVGNTVNAEEASYTNDIGQPILAACWKDPDFDPARVLSTTCVSWRSRSPAGPLTAPGTSVSSFRKERQLRTTNAFTHRPFGIVPGNQSGRTGIVNAVALAMPLAGERIIQNEVCWSAARPHAVYNTGGDASRVFPPGL